jgi:hypothetical protein
VTFSIQGTGTANGAVVTPYLTGASAAGAAQAPVRVSGRACLLMGFLLHFFPAEPRGTW